MRLISTFATAARRLRPRLGAEDGFTMLIALGVLSVTALLTAALYVGVLGNVHSGQHDLDSKRAYAAALAGAQQYLYQLNQQPEYWETCANDTQAITAVPGSTTGEEYSYTYIPANGNTTCSASTAINDLIDSATGTLRMEFTGYSGGDPQVSRTIVASFRKASPLNYLWFTVYEALDSSISGYGNCGQYLRVTPARPTACNIQWFSQDQVNGPMYTQDQYLIGQGATPTFGRAGMDDAIQSMAGSASDPQDACDIGGSGGAVVTQNSCGSAKINGNLEAGAATIGLPTANTQLETDAQTYGKVYTGTTQITINGATATVTNCPSSCTTSSVNLATYPIIYVANGCTPTYTYDPFNTSYPTTGCTGDVYVTTGTNNYTAPVTIAAANNIIIDGPITTTTSNGAITGNATMGLVANGYIRVEHGVQNRSDGYGECSVTNGRTTTDASNIASETFSNLTIDAAILALDNSFIVDNFDCGATLGNLIVNGAMIQKFRGAVATGSGATVSTGYAKDYTYDDRLAVLEPPYLFDIAVADWSLVRETLCTHGGTPTTTC